MQPASRVLKPGDVAGLVAFLCSDEAALMTGQHLHVEGGCIRGD
jgi:acetoacetyl-CoA reductase